MFLCYFRFLYVGYLHTYIHLLIWWPLVNLCIGFLITVISIFNTISFLLC